MYVYVYICIYMSIYVYILLLLLLKHFISVRNRKSGQNKICILRPPTFAKIE